MINAALRVSNIVHLWNRSWRQIYHTKRLFQEVMRLSLWRVCSFIWGWRPARSPRDNDRKDFTSWYASRILNSEFQVPNQRVEKGKDSTWKLVDPGGVQSSEPCPSNDVDEVQRFIREVQGIERDRDHHPGQRSVQWIVQDQKGYSMYQKVRQHHRAIHHKWVKSGSSQMQTSFSSWILRL